MDASSEVHRSGEETAHDGALVGSTAQITLENGVLTVKAGYDWNRDIRLQLVGETADGTKQTVNLHLSAVAIVGENKSFNKADLVGTTLTSNIKGINADNAGLSFKLFFSENKMTLPDARSRRYISREHSPTIWASSYVSSTTTVLRTPMSFSTRYT